MINIYWIQVIIPKVNQTYIDHGISCGEVVLLDQTAKRLMTNHRMTSRITKKAVSLLSFS